MTTDPHNAVPGKSELGSVLGAYKRTFAAVAGFSGLINILMLTGSIFMLQVYDRVLPSRSVPTLIGLAILVAVLYSFQGILDSLRGRVITRIAAAFDQRMGKRIFNVVVNLPLKARHTGDGLRPMRDFDQIGGFLSGPGPSAFFDLPWMPLYIAICFAFHPALGIAALCGAIILVIIAFLADRAIRLPNRAVAAYAARRNALAEAGQRNAEVLAAMGMRERLAARWTSANDEHRRARSKVNDVAGGYGALTRVIRLGLQSLVLGIGAYLVIIEQATAGIIIASSILTARGLAPVEQAIAHWRNFLASKQSWTRLNELLAAMPEGGKSMPLPAPHQKLAVETVSIIPPGGRKAVLDGIAFTLEAGTALGVIGPSASGKSSLARAIAGVWPAARGKVRLDGAALEHWSSSALGQHVGYLPQDVELFSGSVADNIARFDENRDPEAVVRAAKDCGVHDMILRLPQGYDTEIGEGGAVLSAGQRQRVALARALYGEPFLVVLDEPNSNMDADGEEGLRSAITSITSRGGIVVVIAHRPSAIENVDLLLVMSGGRQQAFGPKAEVLNSVLRRETSRPLVVVQKDERAAQ